MFDHNYFESKNDILPLMETAAKELGHIEMLATAVAKNLENALQELREETAKDPIIATMEGGQPRQMLTVGMGGMSVV